MNLFAQMDLVGIGTVIGAAIATLVSYLLRWIEEKPLTKQIAQQGAVIESEKIEKERIKGESDRLYERLVDFCNRLAADNARLGNAIEAMHMDGMRKTKRIADLENIVTELRGKIEEQKP
jgi:hypothetical protein